MFTGIVETIGTVKSTQKVGGDVRITINAPDFASRVVNLGDSIAINGVCLTVIEHQNKDFVFDASQSDMQKFDKIIDELEPGALRLPVLLKKYVKQNAKLVAFNVDPKFNNAIDGLMYIRIADLPESTVKPVMEEFQAELERKHSENENN